MFSHGKTQEGFTQVIGRDDTQLICDCGTSVYSDGYNSKDVREWVEKHRAHVSPPKKCPTCGHQL